MVSRRKVHGQSDATFLDGCFYPFEIAIVPTQWLVQKGVCLMCGAQLDKVGLFFVSHTLGDYIRCCDERFKVVISFEAVFVGIFVEQVIVGFVDTDHRSVGCAYC